MMRRIPLVAVFIAAVIAANSFFIVREGEDALLLQFGRIVRAGYAPGIHAKIPLIQQAKKFDKRVLDLESQPERYLTSEKKDVTIDFFVKWRIVDAGKFYVSVAGREDHAALRIGPIVKEGLRTAVNSRTLQELVSGGRADMTGQIVAEADRATRGLGVEIVDLRIKRIDLPEDGNVIKSVYDRMSAERKKVANKLRAEGEEAAATIRADADRQVQVIKAEAYRDAEKTRGEGDAEASTIYAAAFGRDPEFYGFYRSLEAYRASLGDDSLLLLDPKSEFLRELQGNAR